MKLTRPTPSSPRKTPIQSRSTVTVDAIFEAAIQVLLRDGADRLTTTSVAGRAGVSVGTLYQYFPNKQSLLFHVLDMHLEQVTVAVEQACAQHHHDSLDAMVIALVEAFVSAKMKRKDVSVALYAISAMLGGEALVSRFQKRSRTAVTAMFRTAPDIRVSELDFTVLMLLSAMAGATRSVLEAGATRKMIDDLRHHLALLTEGYVLRAAVLVRRTQVVYSMPIEQETHHADRRYRPR